MDDIEVAVDLLIAWVVGTADRENPDLERLQVLIVGRLGSDPALAKLDAEVAFYKHLADIQVLPTLEVPGVSPADFSHTDELMRQGYKSCRKYLASTAPAAAPVRQPVLAALAARQAA